MSSANVLNVSKVTAEYMILLFSPSQVLYVNDSGGKYDNLNIVLEYCHFIFRGMILYS